MKHEHRRALVGVLLLAAAYALVAFSPVRAQTLEISKNADFSTEDDAFTFDDTLYARVIASHIDYSDLEKNEYRFKTPNEVGDVRGEFTNHLDGTYTTQIVLASLVRTENNWEFRAEIRDGDGNRFRSRRDVTITETPPPPTFELEGRIEELGSDSLVVTGKTIFVDDSTSVTEFDEPLEFSDLRVDWKVHVRAEERSEGRLWAVAIEVLERSPSGQEVETRGRVANVQDSVMIVNDIAFHVTATTELQDRDGAPADLATFVPGVLVQARGVADETGDVIADRIQIEDDNFADQEIQFTGSVNALFSEPPLPDSIQINGDLFEVDEQTGLQGFYNEPIDLVDLRPGETVEIRARTRLNQLSVALEIRRAESTDEVQVTGQIENLGDSSLVVSGLEFQIAPTTIILDDENLFIPFSALFMELVVEVRATRGENDQLVATRIKVEDEVNDQVELSGFVEGLTDTSITVAGSIFLVNALTRVLDEAGAPTTFSALQLGMTVELRGERRFNGSVLATEIQIEDFLQDEIQLRGTLAELGSDSLQVTGVTFFVDGNTVVVDLDGTPIPFQELTIGEVVEVRAAQSEGRWLASRIEVEERIDPEISLVSAIDSLDTDAFHALGLVVRITERTLLLGPGDEIIAFDDLGAGEVVEAYGRFLPDSSLVALRLQQVDRDPMQVEARGSIIVQSADTVAVASIKFGVDATTNLLDSRGRPLAFSDLRDGQIAAARGVRQISGAVLADGIQLQEHRLLTGVVDQVQADTVTIAGLNHTVGRQSVLVDEQNRPIPLGEIKRQQQVRVVANLADDHWEILYLRILFRGDVVSVEDRPRVAVPKEFALYQNYPNPFSSSGASLSLGGSVTTIRFQLPVDANVSLVIYNQLGQRVRTLLSARFPSGLHEYAWDGSDDTGRPVATGVYFYRLQVGRHAKIRRMVVVR